MLGVEPREEGCMLIEKLNELTRSFHGGEMVVRAIDGTEKFRATIRGIGIQNGTDMLIVVEKACTPTGVRGSWRPIVPPPSYVRLSDLLGYGNFARSEEYARIERGRVILVDSYKGTFLEITRTLPEAVEV